MRHDHPLDTGLAQLPHPGAHGTVQALTRLPHDGCPEMAGPFGHLGVVAHHGDGERRAGGNHPFGHGPDQVDTHGV